MGDQNQLSSEMATLKMESSEIKENYHETTSTTKSSSGTTQQNEVVKQEANNEKKNIDEQPKKPKNWNDLPNELKVKVIESCDFKTRIHVGMTCRLGKALVEKGTPIVWERLEFYVLDEHISIQAFAQGVSLHRSWYMEFDGMSFDEVYSRRIEDATFDYSNESLKNLINAIAYVFKSEVETLQIGYIYHSEFVLPDWFFEELRKRGPFNFRNTHTDTSSFAFKNTSKLLDVFFENCGLPVEMCYCRSDFNSAEDICNVVDKIYKSTCREVRIRDNMFESEYEKVMTRVLKLWIDKDVPIGTRFSIMCWFRTSSDVIYAPLHNLKSIINYESSQFLIRFEEEEEEEDDDVANVNGKPKTILIRKHIPDGLIAFEVIPTELLPSEYKEFALWFRREES